MGLVRFGTSFYEQIQPLTGIKVRSTLTLCLAYSNPCLPEPGIRLVFKAMFPPLYRCSANTISVLTALT